MAKPLFDPNFTISDNPPRHADFAPGDWELMAAPPNYKGLRPKTRGSNSGVILAVALAGIIVLIGVSIWYSSPAGSAQPTVNMKDCESGFEVFPPEKEGLGGTTVIYMLSDECSKIRAADLEEQKAFLAKNPINLPPAVKPVEKIDDSLLDEQQ